MENQIISEEKTTNGGVIGKLAAVLRIAGVGALFLASITYLVQSLDFDSSFNRIANFGYLLLAVFGLGLFCNYIIKEVKSAKIGMGIAIGMIPVISLQLSAIIYASVIEVTRHYPKYLAYNGFENNAQLFVSMIGIIIFSLLTAVAIKVLIPDRSTLLRNIYLSGVFILLLPFRGNLTTALLAGICLGLCIFFERKSFQKDSHYQSAEAFYLRFVIIAPAFVILLRNYLLYDTGNISLSLVFAGLAITFGQIISGMKDSYYSKSKVLAALCTFIFWVLFVNDLSETFIADYRYYIIYLPVVVYALSLKNKFPSSASFMNLLANVAFALAIFSQQSVNGELLDTSIALVLCILGIAYAWTGKDRLTLYVCGISLLSLLGNYWEHVVRLYELNPWMFMGVSGIGFILVAGCIEKNISKLKVTFSRFK